MVGQIGMPHVTYAHDQLQLKYEDIVYHRLGIQFPELNYTYGAPKESSKYEISRQRQPANDKLEDSAKFDRYSVMRGEFNSYNLFCLMDGHVGDDCAALCMKNVHEVLFSLVPKGYPPAEHTPQFTSWLAHLERAIATTFATLNNMFASFGSRAGSTLTVVVQFGWNLMVANVGDSTAVVQCKSGNYILTDEHRLQSNKGEIDRCRALGYIVASICPFSLAGPADPNIKGIGPLRLWPGGIALSRSVGDFSVGMATVAAPSIRHVKLPWEGARLVIASDGVWDGYPSVASALKYVRKEPPSSAAMLMTQRAVQLQVNQDDASAIVVDIMPREGMKFSDVVSENKKKWSLFSCLKPSAVVEQPQGPPANAMQDSTLQFVGYTDMLIVLHDLGFTFKVDNHPSVAPPPLGQERSLGAWTEHPEEAKAIFNLFKNSIRKWCRQMLQPVPIPRFSQAEEQELQIFEMNFNRQLKRSASTTSTRPLTYDSQWAHQTSSTKELHTLAEEMGGLKVQGSGRFRKPDLLEGQRALSSEVADPMCQIMPSFVSGPEAMESSVGDAPVGALPVAVEVQ